MNRGQKTNSNHRIEDLSDNGCYCLRNKQKKTERNRKPEEIGSAPKILSKRIKKSIEINTVEINLNTE